MIKVEAVDISNISNIFPGSAFFLLHFFTECNFSAAINALSLTKETANTSNRIYIRRGIWNQQIFLFFDIAFDNIRLGPVPKFLEQKELE